MRRIASIFIEAGARFLDISAGVPVRNSQLTRPSRNEHFYRYSQFRYAKQFKEWFPDTAIIGSAYTTGDSSSIDFAEENVRKGYTDFAGFGRQNLADAAYPVKIKEAARLVGWCTLCGKCSAFLARDVEVYCGYHHSKNPYT